MINLYVAPNTGNKRCICQLFEAVILIKGTQNQDWRTPSQNVVERHKFIGCIVVVSNAEIKVKG